MEADDKENLDSLLATQESAAIWSLKQGTINGALITSNSQFANILPRTFIFRKDNTYLLTFGTSGQETGSFLVANQTYNAAFNVFDISMTSSSGTKYVFSVTAMTENKLS